MKGAAYYMNEFVSIPMQYSFKSDPIGQFEELSYVWGVLKPSSKDQANI